MDLEHIRHQLDSERRTGVLDGGIVEQLPLITRARSDDRSRYCVCFSALSDINADRHIADQVDFFRSKSGEVEWKVYAHDEPSDLLSRLERHGFDVGPCEAVLVLDLQAPPSWVAQPSTHRVERVNSLDQVRLFRELAEQIFAGDWSGTAGELELAIQSASTNHLAYIAFDGDAPAAIGRLLTQSTSVFGGLYGGATLAAHRGRGLYRALVAARAVNAAQLGARYLLVDALTTSRPILESLGFDHLTDTWPCTLQK